MGRELSKGFKSRFVPTSTYKEIKWHIDMGMQIGGVISALGNPGLGKSHALMQIQSEYPRSAYLEISQGTKSNNGLLNAILREARIYGSKQRNLRDMETAIKFSLAAETDFDGQKNRFLLILDEVQTLEIAVCRNILHLQKEADFCLVLAGNNERLAASGKSKLLKEQIETRITFRCEITKPTEQDCKSIAAAFNVEGTKAYEHCVKLGRHTNLRILSDILTTASHLNGGVSGLGSAEITLAAQIKLQRSSPTLKLIGAN